MATSSHTPSRRAALVGIAASALAPVAAVAEVPDGDMAGLEACIARQMEAHAALEAVLEAKARLERPVEHMGGDALQQVWGSDAFKALDEAEGVRCRHLVDMEDELIAFPCRTAEMVRRKIQYISGCRTLMECAGEEQFDLLVGSLTNLQA
ncbi:hypothetical protein [Phreatobacter sp.]|uniref:hypothetical protein n=1 Tax=Phreatobacter sp. TaxID=1966341 RepID=UPI003F72CFEC